MRISAGLAVLVGCGHPAAPVSKEALGQRLFEDITLSEPAGQSCADCHDAKAAFADPEGERTSEGAVAARFGQRNAQSLMYAAFVPPLRRDGARVTGGLFWDGRADTLAQQAAVPFLNPLEMNNASKEAVVARVRRRHARAFEEVYAAGALDDPDIAYARICDAIAAFERSRALAPFTSKFDRHLAGQATLDEREARGLALFTDHCASCHPPPMFTDFSYANLGLPRFADNPFYRLPRELADPGPDRGLGRTTGDPRHDGLFRVPTLRNVVRTTPYGHNGYFRRLDEMIAFHATMKTTPEVPQTVDRSRLARFAPTKQDIADLVAFLRTLTDEGFE